MIFGKYSACVASSLTIYFFYLIQKHRTDFIYQMGPLTLMVTVEMCVGICVSCMPLLARLYGAKKDKLSSNFSFLGKRFMSLPHKAKWLKASEKPNGDPENRTYTRIEASTKDGGPPRLGIHITGATMSLSTQTSVV
jgi:hypothetical protein